MNQSVFGGTELPPGVLKALRLAALRRLRDQGAMSTTELAQSPVEVDVLSAPLSTAELEVVLESARRHELVHPLGHTQRADGSEPSQLEWVLTERGRREVSGLGAWAVGLGSRAGSALRGVAPVAAALGVGGLLQGRDISPWVVAGIAFSAFYIAWVVLAILWRRAQGARPDEIAQHWERLRTDHPASYEYGCALGHMRKRATWSLVASGAAALAVVVYVLTDSSLLFFLGVLPAAGLYSWAMFPALTRLDRAQKALAAAERGA